MTTGQVSVQRQELYLSVLPRIPRVSDPDCLRMYGDLVCMASVPRGGVAAIQQLFQERLDGGLLDDSDGFFSHIIMCIGNGGEPPHEALVSSIEGAVSAAVLEEIACLISETDISPEGMTLIAEALSLKVCDLPIAVAAFEKAMQSLGEETGGDEQH